MDNLDLDPELAALLEDIPDTPVKKTPSIKKESLFSSSAAAIGEGPSGPEDVDLTESSFTKIENSLQTNPMPFFQIRRTIKRFSETKMNPRTACTVCSPSF